MYRILLSLFTAVIFAIWSPAATSAVNSSDDFEFMAEPADGEPNWKLSFRGGLNGSQASFRDWQSGGVSTVSITANTVFDARYRFQNWGYRLGINLRYGQARIEDEYRKTEDQIAVRNQLRYFLGSDVWSGLFDVNFQTQFDIGKDKDNIVTVSRFFSPAYLSQILGISYEPVDYFSAGFGFSMKQTFVNDINLSTRHGLKEGDTFRNEAGSSLLLTFEKEIFENVTMKSSLETFTNLTTALDKTDYSFTNELSADINSYLSTNFQFVMVYNSDVIDKIQYKQVLSVGLTFRFI